MSLKYKEVNPLAVFNMRRLDFCPPHFEIVRFDRHVFEKKITDWIYEHTTGRFYLGSNVFKHSDSFYWSGPNYSRPPQPSLQAGFEIHAEASYFAMFLTEINRDEDSFY